MRKYLARFGNRQMISQFGQYSKSNKFDGAQLDYTLPHQTYTKEQLDKIQIDHREACTIGDHFANYFVKSIRIGFDVMSGYTKIFPWQDKFISERLWINRVIFLETIAGVPGFIAAMHRHLQSLRGLKRDNGWIHTLLEEAENERVHLLTFIHLKQPSYLFRTGIILAQFYYVALFGMLYFVMPRVCHRIVGYLEEQAVVTYTHMIEEINKETSSIHHWKKLPASPQSIQYWGLDVDATMLDVVKAIRKDEEHHKSANHEFADDYTQKKKNIIPPGG